MSKKKIDVEGILNTLATIRKQIPHLPAAPPSPRETTADAALLSDSEEAMELFEMETLAGALESFAGEVSAAIDDAEQKAMAQALQIYYAAEELAKDPEHAHLIPYVEQMRAVYRRDFGKDIPKK
ncbi:MAG TPA: hypothetical protein VGO18_38975 [Steroidobacteraceae bacterium]|jgi:hypothetical protein|nr:hypothetical protein [Steroidobacteraceae bacterium]